MLEEEIVNNSSEIFSKKTTNKPTFNFLRRSSITKWATQSGHQNNNTYLATDLQ